MRINSIYFVILAAAVTLSACSRPDVDFEMSRAERSLINSGNKAFNDSIFEEAITSYNRALSANPDNPVTLYNLATAQHALQRHSASPAIPGQKSEPDSITSLSISIFDSLIKDPRFDSISQRAAYNAGNTYFDNQALSEAIERYKQALRINPDDNNARRNLRYAQLQQQNQDNQDNQDQQNQDQQDQQDQQEQQQNQNQDQQNQQQPQQPQPQQHQMSQENIEQILKAMENAENRTRQKADQKEQQQQSQRKVLKPW